ncbi:MAG: flavodoxin family protein [Sphaerochaetaceae bacterium]|nr:flavodoxin family protein [Sphaerochaetaceae bacterium]MDD3669846.1 flavodoxin family protein [Sphaerochaetaceae bacterium]MDD4762685.1 flavodoxin family protein [Sphaerochaetaceae bacterium]MDD4840539.1 flavodoxin family protein [Sphaerochaetaceae bacterium]MDD5075994.1 flavodoxin family protein [Sphaerochaetaceae bacterium]
MMQVLMINGSPHEKGCTYTALNEVSKSLSLQGIESEILWIGEEAIHGCVGCGYCTSHKACKFSDDKVNEAASKALVFDALILSSPVHYASACGSACAFYDRLFRIVSKDLALKPGASVVSCRRGGASAAFDRLNKYFTISQMPVVSSTYWNSVHGNTPEEVAQDLEGLQVMRNLGENLGWLLRCIELASREIERPITERGYKTNFIR